MTEFVGDLMKYDFLRVALAAGLLASVACGVVGTYVVARRISYIAGGIAHGVLGGIGAAYWLGRVGGVTWVRPIHGALVAAVLSAGLVAWVSTRAKQWEDTIISAIWASGMSAGVLFVAATPGYAQDLMGYLFGDILMVSKADLAWLAGLDVVVLGVCVLFGRQLAAVCLDPDFARARGVNVEGFYLLLLVLTALTVVLVSTVVGIVMVIAMLSLPVAIAGMVARRLTHMMIGAVALSIVFVVSGFAVSYGPEWPTGATVVLLAGAAYLLCAVVRGIVRRGKG